MLNQMVLNADDHPIVFSEPRRQSYSSMFTTVAVVARKKCDGRGRHRRDSKQAAALAVLLLLSNQTSTSQGIASADINDVPHRLNDSAMTIVAPGYVRQTNKTALCTLKELCSRITCGVNESELSCQGLRQFHASMTVRGKTFSASGPSKKAANQAVAIEALEKVFHIRFGSEIVQQGPLENAEVVTAADNGESNIGYLCYEKFSEVFPCLFDVYGVTCRHHHYAGIVMRTAGQPVERSTGKVTY